LSRKSLSARFAALRASLRRKEYFFARLFRGPEGPLFHQRAFSGGPQPKISFEKRMFSDAAFVKMA